MSVRIFLGEPPEHIKQWIINHRPVSSGIMVNYENGTSVEVSSPFNATTMESLTSSDIVSITVPDGASIDKTATDLFKACAKLSEITFGDNTTVPDDIETTISTWSLGLDEEGNTHLVVLYYGNGVVVVSNGDDSSGTSRRGGVRVDWNKFVEWLEDFGNSSLPEPGNWLTVPYKVDPNGKAVDTEWMILGYNKDIPRFVKYKDVAGNRVYMDVLPGDLLLTSFSDANVYSTKDGTGLVGTVSATGGVEFTYGNNNTYSVPGTITVNGTVYTFCGYNVTLQSKCILKAKYDGKLYDWCTFNAIKEENYEVFNGIASDWKTSQIREWLNGTNAISSFSWEGYNKGEFSVTTGTIVGLLGRLPDANFTGNIIPTVTRTWTHSSWRDGTEDSNGCQHLADKFRILGVGEVNCKGQSTTQVFPDGGASVDGENKGYETSRFSEVFNETDLYIMEHTRFRYQMEEDGTTTGRTSEWWLRSAGKDTGQKMTVGVVEFDYGSVSTYNVNEFNGVVPVCLIG